MTRNQRLVFVALALLFLFILIGIITNGNAQDVDYYILRTNDVFDGRVVTVIQPAYNQYGDELVLVEFTECPNQHLYSTCGHLGVKVDELEKVQ